MANRLPGTAVKLTQGGDIAFSEDEFGNTYPTIVTGRGEIEQAIRIRLNTRLYDDEISPTVGLPVGTMVGLFNPNYIRGTIARCLADEPRIARVGEIEVTLDRAPRIANVAFTVTLIDGTSFTMTEAFGV